MEKMAQLTSVENRARQKVQIQQLDSMTAETFVREKTWTRGICTYVCVDGWVASYRLQFCKPSGPFFRSHGSGTRGLSVSSC